MTFSIDERNLKAKLALRLITRVKGKEKLNYKEAVTTEQRT